MYVVKKPFSINGKRRVIGETLPDDAVTSATLERAGYVTKIDSGLLDVAEGVLNSDADKGGINVPIITKDGSTGLRVDPAIVCDAIRMLQTAADEVIDEMKTVESEDLLIILDACDRRGNVHSAVRKRAAALKGTKRTEDGSAGDV